MHCRDSPPAAVPERELHYRVGRSTGERAFSVRDPDAAGRGGDRYRVGADGADNVEMACPRHTPKQPAAAKTPWGESHPRRSVCLADCENGRSEANRLNVQSLMLLLMTGSPRATSHEQNQSRCDGCPQHGSSVSQLITIW